MRRRARPRATRSKRSSDLDTFAGLLPAPQRLLRAPAREQGSRQCFDHAARPRVAFGAVMAGRVSLEGSVYVKRSPTGAYLLTVVTLLVYFFVWYYKINDETRRHLRDDSIRPWHSG